MDRDIEFGLNTYQLRERDAWDDKGERWFIRRLVAGGQDLVIWEGFSRGDQVSEELAVSIIKAVERAEIRGRA